LVKIACGELIIAPLASDTPLVYLFKTPIAAGFKQLTTAAAPNMRGRPLPSKNHTPLERPIIPVAGGLILKWWSRSNHTRVWMEQKHAKKPADIYSDPSDFDAVATLISNQFPFSILA
jgi:hypothetical protein